MEGVIACYTIASRYKFIIYISFTEWNLSVTYKTTLCVKQQIFWTIGVLIDTFSIHNRFSYEKMLEFPFKLQR